MNFVLVSNIRGEYSKNNAFPVNHITFNVEYGTVFGLLDPNASRH